MKFRKVSLRYFFTYLLLLGCGWLWEIKNVNVVDTYLKEWFTYCWW